jgi:chloride channel protein, CIC family
VEDQFEKLPIDELWWPAIGALGPGIIGYFVPRVLGVGYDTINDILNASLGLKLLVVVMAAKAVAPGRLTRVGDFRGLAGSMFMSSAALGGAFAMIMSGRESLGGSVCVSGHGRGIRGGLTSDVFFHHLCV